MNKPETTPGTLTGVFRTRDNADRAYDALIRRGYTANEITVLMSDETHNTFKDSDRESDLGNRSMEGAGVGSAIGGTAGAIVGALAALGTAVALPGLGLVIAGPIVAGLTGAGAGGLTGGLIGALVGSGIPKERAEYYQSSLEEGGIVIGVVPRTADEGAEIAEEWRRYEGEEIHGHDTSVI